MPGACAVSRFPPAGAASDAPLAAAILTGCVAITVILGALLAHHTREGTLDAAVDTRIRAGLGGHPELLSRLAMLGDWLPVAVVASALFRACLITRRWRGAALVAVVVPVAHALTGRVLKPLIGALAVLAIAGAVAIALVGKHAHYFSDTVGGAVVGTAVVLATAFFLDWLAPVLQGRPLRGRSQP